MLALRVHPLRRWLIPVTLATFSCEYMKTHFARQMDGLTSSASYMLVADTMQAISTIRAPLLPPCDCIILFAYKQWFQCCNHSSNDCCRWFHYRLTGARDLDLTMNMVNAGKASFAQAWTGYNACASYDRRHWFRVPTSYDESSGVLSIQHKPEQVSPT